MFSQQKTYLLMSLALDVHMVHKMSKLIHLHHTFVKFDKYGVSYPEGILLPESAKQWTFDLLLNPHLQSVLQISSFQSNLIVKYNSCDLFRFISPQINFNKCFLVRLIVLYRITLLTDTITHAISSVTTNIWAVNIFLCLNLYIFQYFITYSQRIEREMNTFDYTSGAYSYGMPFIPINPNRTRHSHLLGLPEHLNNIKMRQAENNAENYPVKVVLNKSLSIMKKIYY